MLGQFLTNASTTLRCRHCGARLGYQWWVWALMAFMFGTLLVVLAGIGVDIILADRAARATMRWVFLAFVGFSLAISAVAFALGPFRVVDRR